jgi:hypothetical protein
MMRRMTDQERRHVTRATELVAEASRHHRAAVKANERNDDAGVERSHDRLGDCLRSAQAALERAAAEGSSGLSGGDGSGDNASVGVGGIPAGGGTSRHGSPLLYGDIGGFLERARIGARRR